MKPPLAVLLTAMSLCGGLVAWAAVTALEAKRCLEGQDFSAAISARGCEIGTAAGGTVVEPIPGPPFEAGVAGAAGFLVLTVVLVLTRRARRVSTG
ncbi:MULTISPECIES: hypothetical protein [Amycolatopsis]|uniref:Secreted protein n=1 Tax=Amycolatopsis thermalba TaxID=944492 RepID=A0ABY4P1V7_9PSEU|nr:MULTISPECIES: hypothetical protein [Amycolatopsis]OXM64450.1 hypothetical protein CF166_30305 [Amycolatopsis sp. KNN50.9b]UQS26256.1 hypothetical protein L1857_27290 [Amycolatopsis thermalba]